MTTPKALQHKRGPKPDSAIRRDEERRKQLATLSTLGIAFPPGIPSQAVEILVASAFMTRPEIEQVCHVSRYRVDTVLENYPQIRDALIAQKDTILSGLSQSVTFLYQKQLRDVALSGKIKARTVSDLQGLSNVAATSSRIALQHGQAQPTAPATAQPGARDRAVKLLERRDNTAQTTYDKPAITAVSP